MFSYDIADLKKTNLLVLFCYCPIIYYSLLFFLVVFFYLAGAVIIVPFHPGAERGILGWFHQKNCLKDFLKRPQKSWVFVALFADGGAITGKYQFVLCIDVYTKFSCNLYFMLLTAILFDIRCLFFRHGIRIDFTIELLQEFFVLGCYKKLLSDQTQIFAELPEHAWQTLITSISSLPDHIANKLQSRKR